MRPIMTMTASIAALALSACTVAIDNSTVFAPQPLRPINGEAPDGGVWGESIVKNPTDAPPTTDNNRERAIEKFSKEDFTPTRVSHGFFGADGARIAWSYFERDGAARALIIHCGGNAADRWSDGLVYALKALPQADVFLFDYPGYGDSDGAPSAAAFDAAGEALRFYIAQRFSDRTPVFWGHSLGGFVCAQWAGKSPSAAGVILETTAANVRDVADAWVPWYAKPFVRVQIDPELQPYDNAAALAGFEGPILVIAGRKDKTLPPRLARSLASDLTAGGLDVSFVEFPDAGHANVWAAENFRVTISEFFDRLASTERHKEIAALQRDIQSVPQE